VTYGWQATYADPTASAIEHLTSSAVGIGVFVAVLIGAAVVAVTASSGARRRAMSAISVALVVTAAICMVAANHYGLEAKQREASSVPECALNEERLNELWRSLKHPGYFGGGEQSRSHCAYEVTARDLSAVLTDYQEQLEQRGWRVSESTPTRVVATRQGYAFEAAVTRRQTGQSSGAMSVTLRGPA
jgi:hypothetical protein